MLTQPRPVPPPQPASDGVPPAPTSSTTSILPSLDPSLASVDGPICRICFEKTIKKPNGTLEHLVFACRCKGSIGMIHLSCLQRWLTVSQTARCELCHFEFPTKRVQKYTKLKSLVIWLNQGVDSAQLVFDLLALLIMTPIIGISLFMAYQSTRWLDAEFLQQEETPRAAYATTAGLVLLGAISAAGYVLWVYVTISYYCKSWKAFYLSESNIIVTLHERTAPAPAAAPSPTPPPPPRSRPPVRTPPVASRPPRR